MAGFTPTAIELILLNAVGVFSVYIVLSGGLFAFAFVVFMGIGAYAAAILASHGHSSMLVQALTGIGIAAVSAMLLFLMVARLRGIYLGIVTVGLTAIFGALINNFPHLTGGPLGLPGVSLNVHLPALIAAVGFLCVVFAAIQHSKLGRRVKLLRTDPLVAGTLGVNVRLLSGGLFVASSVVAAFAGCLQAHYLGFVSPDSFNFTTLILFLEMAVIGGVSHWAGPIVGALVVTMIPQWLQSFQILSPVVSGAILLLTILFLPEGIVGGVLVLGRSAVIALRGEPRNGGVGTRTETR